MLGSSFRSILQNHEIVLLLEIFEATISPLRNEQPALLKHVLLDDNPKTPELLRAGWLSQYATKET